MFFVDAEGRITRVAGSLAEWLNLDSEALVGQPITTIVSAEDTGPVEVALCQVEETQTAQTIACHFVVGDEAVPVELELTPVAAGSELGTIMGIVQRESLPSGESTTQLVELRNYIELLEDPAVVCSMAETDPIVQAVNTAFEEVFGHKGEYLIGKSLNDYIVPSGCQNEATQFDTEIAAGNVKTEIVRRKTASGIQEFSYRGLPIEDTSGHTHGVAIYGDIKKEQQAKEHLQVLHRVLRHNVRNELTVILGMAETITENADGTEIQSAAERIISRAENLGAVSEKARIAENILGEAPSDTVVEIGGIATEVAADARTVWPEATIDTDIETPVPVSTGQEIRDVLENLVENAITHNTGSPSVRIAIGTETPIQVSTRENQQNAIITIEDNGPGIPETEQAVVFDDEDINQLKHGSGLGLWVVRWIVEATNGTISYSRSDDWTTISIRLPLATD